MATIREYSIEDKSTRPIIREYDPVTKSPLQDAEQKKSFVKKAWEALTVPEQLSRQGLGKIAQSVPSPEPTGNLPLDILRGTPRIAAETIAEVAPSFISRGSLVTAGALKGLQVARPVTSAIGKFIGKTAESTSGLGYKTPGVLAEAVRRPSLIFGKGIEKAREAYQDAKGIPQIRESMKVPQNTRVFIKQAWKALSEGNITPDEALEARKAVDSIGEQMPDVVRKSTRAVFNNIAKQKYAEADKAFSDAIKSDALRSFWGINKSGTPSIVKGALTLGSAAGGYVSPLSPFIAAALSPVVQGSIASGIGGASKVVYPFISRPLLGLPLGAAKSILFKELEKYK